MTRSLEHPEVHDPEQWARLWLRHLAEHRQEDFWAWEQLMLTAHDAPERAWPVVLKLIEIATDDDLQFIGAGPLEDIFQEHAPQFVERAEHQAASDPKFRECLATIWLNRHYLPGDVVDRLVAATGGRLLVNDLDYEELDRLDSPGTPPN